MGTLKRETAPGGLGRQDGGCWREEWGQCFQLGDRWMVGPSLMETWKTLRPVKLAESGAWDGRGSLERGRHTILKSSMGPGSPGPRLQ